MNGRIRFPVTIHLKWFRPKSAHDKSAVAIGCTVQLAVPVIAQVMTGDENAVGMRMVVQVHEFCFSEGGRYRVVPGRHVGGLPKSCRRASCHLQLVAFLRELGVFDRLTRLLCSGIDLPGPPGDSDAS